MNLPFFLAEALDKEPGPLFVWSAYGTLAILGFVLCRRWRWCLALFVPLNLLAVWASMTELWDADVGPAILQESPSLFVQWHVVLLFALVGPVTGFIVGFPKRKVSLS